jgi:DNA (cytosine-5)-methyltransferase 1
VKTRLGTLSAVDLFAGGGGLTLGLKQAGFAVAAAVEIEQHSFSTYKVNHPEVRAFRQDICTIAGSDLLACAPNKQVDLLAGCPPCQGFTSLTSKYRREDPRNALISEMGRLVEEMVPRAVMMENVPGLAAKGRPLFDEFCTRLTTLGYIIRWGMLQVADFGVPQNRRRLVLLAGRDFPIELPKPTHSRTGAGGLPSWRTLRDAIEGLPVPVLLADSHIGGGPQRHDWHVVRGLSVENQARIRAARPGTHWRAMAVELRPDCHKKDGTGFGNVYGRMAWDQVSVTITAGCTTLSKGRFGHPEADRTISVREAALIQTFPPDYVFDTPYMEYVCKIIGNALPCDFAAVVARQCVDALRAESS